MQQVTIAPQLVTTLSVNLLLIIASGCLLFVTRKLSRALDNISAYYKEKVDREILEQEIIRRQFISQMIAEHADHIETILFHEINIVPELDSMSLTRDQYHKIILTSSGLVLDLLPDYIKTDENLNKYVVSQVTRLIDAHIRKNNIQILATEETAAD